MHNMKGMVTKEKVLEVAKKLFPCDLPIGVYLVMKDGEFVRCNRRAREILGLLENEVEVNVNINDFYSNPDERNRLMKELEEAEANGRFLEKKVVIFNVRGQTIWVQDYCRSIKDPATGSIIGYSGCLVDVTEEESFRQLFEKLPVGVYKLNAQDIIVRVNKAYAGILGYEDPSELEGKNIKELYVEPSEADRLDRLIAEQESVVNEKVELFKKNEERCYVSVCAYKKTDTDGRTYIGVEGTIQDVTEEETYRQIRDMLPVGTYLIRKNEEGKEVFEQCNKAFARMFEYEIDELKGKEVRELYASEKDYQNFIAELAEKQEQEDTPEDIPIKAKTSTGKIMTLEVHSRVLVDGAGSIIGRVGLVLDISNEVALWELRDDIGKTLHFYSAALVTLEQSIKPVLKAIGPDPFERDTLLTVENAIKTLSKPADNLKDAIIRLIDMGKTSPGRQSAISEKDWSTLKDLKDSLENFQDISPYPEFQMPTLYEISNKVLDFSNKIEKGKLPRELIKNVSIQAKELQRIYCLIRTHQALDTIIEADYSARALREYVIFQQRVPELPTLCKISTLIQTTIYQLYLFAQHKNVTIRQEYQDCHAEVKVDEREVLRALSNLLYNAIKYSWHLKIGERPQITVKAFTVEDEVHVEFQNYGVPIAFEEIATELIFKFGYRGKYSGDRRRMGTGIGLTDARETARRHGGDVKIISVPDSGEHEFDYSQPFLTTATLILPINKQHNIESEGK